ncbi:nucleoside-diphosphate sugar epimerase/dehydratase [Cecembia sp.]|uniref:polysaccharide biosynthesis protein n=1 Tax=Cecembia sp. TaxID=1898110 RepID=UPI0025C3EF8E|nr:nucleoside-diphosphate sugar epimerase/dehydratase [Cecembia sp.]
MEFFRNLRIVPRWLIVMVDAIIVFHAALFAFFIRFNFNLDQVDRFDILPAVLVFTLLAVVSMLMTHSYVGIVRHTHSGDLVNMMKMLGMAHVLLALIKTSNTYVMWLDAGFFLPFSVGLIASLLAFPLLIGYRLLVKEAYQYAIFTRNKGTAKKVAIYGAGQAGILTYQTLSGHGSSQWQPVAFIDDDPVKSKMVLHGKKIFLGINGLKYAVEKLGVQEVVIAINTLTPQRRREIVDTCLALGIPSKTIPPAEEWFNVGLQTKDIREVRIEDLLSREEILLDKNSVAADIKGKVVMVTGAAGSIGSELSRQLLKCRPKHLIVLDQAESALYDLQQEIKNHPQGAKIEYLIADIRNKDRMREIFNQFRPQLVFHAAAYKHVPMMEAYPEEAIQCNVLGTKILADLSAAYGAEKFVMVSTDKAVNPTNVMGASKRLAEMYVQSLDYHLSMQEMEGHTRFITTRFGNVLGSNGSVIPLFRKQIMEGGPLTVTHPEITRYFMTIPEACQLVLEAGVMGNGGEIYVFDMGEPVKIVDLAKKMIALSGKKLNEDIKIEFTGLRAGEKLYEELLNKDEEVTATHHPKIKIAKVKASEYEMIHDNIGEFHNIIGFQDEFEVVRQLKKLVPEFVSNYSRFSKLDSTKEEVLY